MHIPVATETMDHGGECAGEGAVMAHSTCCGTTTAGKRAEGGQVAIVGRQQKSPHEGRGGEGGHVCGASGQNRAGAGEMACGMADSERNPTEHRAAGKHLSDLPLRKVTAAQLQDDAFIQSCVFIAQDVWHSQERIIRKLPKDHPNYNDICQDIKKAFSVCLPKHHGLLVGTTVKQLRKSISDAADALKVSLRSLLSKYTNRIDTGSRSVVESMMSQINAGEDLGAAWDGADRVQSTTQQLTACASSTRWDRKRRVLEVGWEGCDNNQVSFCRDHHVCCVLLGVSVKHGGVHSQLCCKQCLL
jgi:hypothetical protein